MNPVLKKMLEREKENNGNTSAPPFLMNIRAEDQSRPIPDDLVEHADIPYGDTVQLFGDSVCPKNRKTEKLPVIVFVHGGALVTGDRKSNRVFCQEFARRGFVVYSVEYRLIDRADVFGMVSDVCLALKMVKETLERFGGDPNRVSVCGESAGAFLSLYAAAAGKSPSLCQKFGCTDHGLAVSGLVLISGMINTTGNNPVALFYKKTLYGEKSRDKQFLKSISPNDPGIISLLPPVFLVSSREDFLRNHTLIYHEELEKAHHACRLLYYPEGKALTHAFPSLLPSLPESAEVIKEIVDWERQINSSH